MRIPTKTLNAYNDTSYVVLVVPLLVLTVGKQSQSLLGIHKIYNVDSSLFITSYNPKSKIKSPEINSKYLIKLEYYLKQKYSILPGKAVDPLGEWPVEKSYLALGVSEENAGKIGRAFDQNAVVWCGNDCIPQLLTCF